MSVRAYNEAVNYFSSTRQELLSLERVIAAHSASRPKLPERSATDTAHLDSRILKAKEQILSIELRRRFGVHIPTERVVEETRKSLKRRIRSEVLKLKELYDSEWKDAIARYEADLKRWETVHESLQVSRFRMTNDLITARALVGSYYDREAWETLPIFRQRQTNPQDGVFYRGTLGCRLMFSGSKLVSMDSFMPDTRSVEFSTEPDTALNFAASGAAADNQKDRWDPVVVVARLADPSFEISETNLSNTKLTISVDDLLRHFQNRVFRVKQ